MHKSSAISGRSQAPPTGQFTSVNSEPGSSRSKQAFRRVHVLFVVEEKPSETAVVRCFNQAWFEVEFIESLVQALQHQRLLADVVFFELHPFDAPLEQSAEMLGLVQRQFPTSSIVTIANQLSGEQAAQLLGLGVPSLNKPVSLETLALLAMKLSDRASREATSHVRDAVETRNPQMLEPRRETFESVAARYAVERSLSGRQGRILSLYLAGQTDKQIADCCGCGLTTVYEHWRRMARKAGGQCKQDVIADLHRFMGTIGR